MQKKYSELKEKKKSRITVVAIIITGFCVLCYAFICFVPQKIKETKAYENGTLIYGEIIAITNEGYHQKLLKIEFTDENGNKQILYRKRAGTLEEKLALIGTKVEILVYDDAGILFGEKPEYWDAVLLIFVGLLFASGGILLWVIISKQIKKINT